MFIRIKVNSKNLKRKERITKLIISIKKELNSGIEPKEEINKENIKIELLNLVDSYNCRKSLLALFRSLEKTTVFLKVQGQNDLIPVLAVAYSVHYANLFGTINKKEKIYIPSDEKLYEIIKLLVRYYRLDPYLNDSSDFENKYKFQIESVRDLLLISKNYGNQWVDYGRLTALPRLRNHIFFLIKIEWEKTNSLRIRSILLQTLQKKYFNKELKLFVFEDDIQEGVFAYIYQLCLRLPDSNGRIPPLEVLNKMFHHSYSLLITYPYERRNQFSGFFLGHPVSYLRYWILHDRIFTSLQYNSMASSYLVSKIFSDLKNSLSYSFCNIYLNEYYNEFTDLKYFYIDKNQFARLITSLSKIKRVEICEKYFINDPGAIDYQTALKFINFVLGNSPKINQGNLPHNCRSSINDLKSIIKNFDDSKILNNANPYTGNSFFELVYKNQNYPDIGHKFETAFRDLLLNLNLNPICGHFEFEGKNYEADCIILKDEYLFCFELKSKPITRQARDGDITTLLIDLIDSFLSATIQTMRIRLALYKNSELNLYESEQAINNEEAPKYKLSFNPKKMSFVSISLIPFGVESLSQPILSGNLFNLFTNWNFDFYELPEKKINELSKKQETFKYLIEQFRKTFGSEKNSLDNLMTSNKFVSFDEIYTFATIAKDGNSFIQMIKNTLYMQSPDCKLSGKILQALDMFRYEKNKNSE